MDKNRVYELAIEALERQKAEINSEIEKFKSEIKDLKTTPTKKRTSAKPEKKRGKSAAERKALSEKMKIVWAARKSKAKKGKEKQKVKAASTKLARIKTTSKIRPKTEAEKKALSLKMKEVWKKRKAKATQKAK